MIDEEVAFFRLRRAVIDDAQVVSDLSRGFFYISLVGHYSVKFDNVETFGTFSLCLQQVPHHRTSREGSICYTSHTRG